ncbi:helix-turn-helix domain-containing protein [Hamadaea tsunoensis]|uniref:helix-turn-helix domain-containing protein n=1 Tax=Hamadaea tsunoensis TaxID=53368 RepID=UPI00042818BA|nr:helix-turn-helix transcriptional regulator [Hamadaea tsunoensis]
MTSPPTDGGTAGGGPTALRILLGANLRRLREARNVTREDAGWQIRASESKISRMELGRVSFKERDVEDLLTLYGLHDGDERERLLALTREANAPGWWHRYSDILPGWFQPYIGLEAAASMIRNYEVQFVPGLLQTEEYARALVRLGHGRADADAIERRVELRMRRQQVLSRPDNPPQFWAVVDEGALRRPMGGRDIMLAQIEALIDATSLPNVRVQIVPFDVGGHAGVGGAFSILRFADPDLPDVVYVEQLTSALYLDKRDDIDQYALMMETLCIEAAPPERTHDLLYRIARDLKGE